MNKKKTIACQVSFWQRVMMTAKYLSPGLYQINFDKI
jgi:hypothetical protein